jgi:hypothetical protein
MPYIYVAEHVFKLFMIRKSFALNSKDECNLWETRLIVHVYSQECYLLNKTLRYCILTPLLGSYTV